MKMKTAALAMFPLSLAAMALVVALAGCGNADPNEGHKIVPPTPHTADKIPTTKEEKIAAVKKAPMSKEMKDAEIAKLNAEP
jgi:hypothetical protein